MPYMDDINNIWEMVKDSLKTEMPESAVNLWFSDLKIVSFDNNVIKFTIGSEFKYNIIIKQNYTDLISRGFTLLLGFDVKAEIEFSGEHIDPDILKSRIDKPQQAEPEKHSVGGTLPPFNFEYTFDNFIVGSSNKFAHAACTAVVENPAKDYNPLFIYGQSGLGKTHLMYAITNSLKKKNPDVKIIYIKGVDFTNQMIDSLARQAMKDFREKYLSCDVLLIDDIQFIAGKVSTQEEFFHTFNSLYEAHKQIILTSDRPPRDIKTLEDRLKTRFEWGLIADVQPPDLELRIAIIKNKAKQVNIDIPDDVLTFLAENLRSNIRQIEGAIKKLAALSFLSGKPITMDTAKGCISELLGGAEPTSVTVEKTFTAIFKKYGIKKEDLTGTRRTKDVAFARHAAIYLIRSITEMSLPNIGKIFNRDHSTIMSSIDTVEKKMLVDQIFSIEIAELRKEITGQSSGTEQR